MVIEAGPSTGIAVAVSMAIGAGAFTAIAGVESTAGAPLTAVESEVSTAAVPSVEGGGSVARTSRPDPTASLPRMAPTPHRLGCPVLLSRLGSGVLRATSAGEIPALLQPRQPGWWKQ
jgi:hypothetical protein